MPSAEPDDEPGDVVSAAVAVTSLAEAEALVRRVFGIAASGRRLSAERDENFLMTAGDGQAYVLKLANPAEARVVTDFQTQALAHIAARDPTLAVPRLIPSQAGATLVAVPVAGRERLARLLTYLPGLPLHEASRSVAQCRALGALLARLDGALAGYSHPGALQPLRWDLCQAATLRPLLAAIEEPGRRALATRFLEQFETEVAPRLPGLRRQVIHNDFQPSNVLVDPNDPTRVSGVIDFGDLVEAPLVNDVAVACAYHVAGAPEPFDYVSALVGAYHAEHPLLAAEVALLYDLLATRLLLTAVITAWRSERHPENRAYILRNAPAAWRGLERCAALGRERATQLLFSALQAG